MLRNPSAPRPGENDEARRSYLFDARMAGLSDAAAHRYADDMLRMDVIEHVEGWSEDDRLYAEWQQLRRRTTLPARRPAGRTYVLQSPNPQSHASTA